MPLSGGGAVFGAAFFVASVCKMYVFNNFLFFISIFFTISYANFTFGHSADFLWVFEHI